MYCHYPRVNTRKDNKKQMVMKKLLIALVIGLIGYACSEEKVGVYSLERDYIYFQYESSRLGTTMNIADSVYLYYNSSSVSVNSSRQRDTFFFRVKVAGMARSVDRKINIEPYSFLTNGREEAIAGVNYVAFDDPEMEKCCVVPADSVSVNIPIIVTYNPAYRTTIDKKGLERLKINHPDVYDGYVNTTESRRFAVKKKGAA